MAYWNLAEWFLETALIFSAVAWWLKSTRSSDAKTQADVIKYTVLGCALTLVLKPLLPAYEIAGLPAFMAANKDAPSFTGLIAIFFWGVIAITFFKLLRFFVVMSHSLGSGQNHWPLPENLLHTVECARRKAHVPANTQVVIPHAYEGTPYTFTSASPVIVLPKSALTWPEERVFRVLLHEFFHVKHRDW